MYYFKMLQAEVREFNRRVADAGIINEKVNAFNDIFNLLQKKLEDDNTYALATFFIFNAKVELSNLDLADIDAKMDKITENIAMTGIITEYKGCL